MGDREKHPGGWPKYNDGLTGVEGDDEPSAESDED